MELKQFPFESTEKFLTVLDCGLVGKSVHVRMDHGEDRLYSFMTEDCVLISLQGHSAKMYQYKSLRADDQTFMAAVELAEPGIRACSTMVFDFENGLVTEVLNRVGTVPGHPRMAVVDYHFGAVCRNGQPLNKKRHGYTTDLLGMKVNWYYSTGFVNTHIYYDPMYYRCKAYYVPSAVSNMVADDLKGSETSGEDVPQDFVDEEARYIRIKKDMYLISFMEENMNRRDPKVGGSNLLILYNTKEQFNIGRSYTYNHDQLPEYGMFKAYADVVDLKTGLEDLPSPYRV